jgi:hypothetical protein
MVKENKKILEAIEKWKKHPYFCNRKVQKRLIKIAKELKPIKILNRKVWVVKHYLLRNKLAIRPFGLIFISEKIPKEFRDIVVKHEIAEEKYERLLSRKEAHKRAIEEEIKYAKKKGKLKKGLEFLKKRYPEAYKERIKILQQSKNKQKIINFFS